ncbi:MAG: hypothetical protein DRN14_03885 [Thermoplasmata archaeon]|nr:MAG: hypothetical protein DRN14_03885 [Thermoplasmata archaeon]
MEILEHLLNGLKKSVVVSGSDTGYIAGTESIDEAIRPMVEGKRSALIADVTAAFESIALDEDIGTSFKPHQVAAASAVALAAVDPIGTLNKIVTKGRADVTAVGESIIVDTTSYMADFIPDNKLTVGNEAFDGQDLSASLFSSIVFNALTIEQDAVTNLFYPIVVMDSNKTGATVTAKVASIMSTVKRDISGKPIELKKESIIKNLNNTKLFTLDSNRLYPVLENDSDGRLLNPAGVSGVTRQVEVFDGVTIETAPYKTQVAVDVLGSAQTDELINRGAMDQNDSLTAHLNVEVLYFAVTGKDINDATITEYHKRIITGLPAIFTLTPTGHNKDLQLDYKTRSITWTGGKVFKADGTPTAIVDLLNLTAGYNVKVAVNLKGDANTQTGSVEVFPVKVAMDSVLDASGNAISIDSATYIKMADIFNITKVEGFDLEAFATNTNARFRGKMLTTDTYTTVYTVPVRAKLREVTAVFNNGSDGDTAGLLGQIQFNKQALTKVGLLELNTALTVLENVSADTEDYGISSRLVSKASHRESVDLTTIVDGLTSSDREADIKAALRLKIKNTALALYSTSGYNKTLEATRPGVKPTVIIGTDTNIGMYVSSFSDEIFNYEVATSNDVLMDGKLFLSFGSMGTNRNKLGDPLSFGVCFWSPETVISLQRQESGAVVQETISMPRYKHQTLMPILGLLEISGVEEVTGKIAQLNKGV